MRSLAFRWKSRLLRLACARLAALPPGQPPGRADVAFLALAWGNPGYAAGPSYLRHLGERASAVNGAVLECGSGATTLLVAALTARTGTEFVVLEHNAAWHELLQRTLDDLGFDHVRLLHAPLKDYGGYLWYEVQAALVPEDIGLVVCDGPPGSTPGGRFGLMPVIGPRLGRRCVILLDDTHRRAERRVIDVWRRYRCLRTSRVGRFGRYAELVLC